MKNKIVPIVSLLALPGLGFAEGADVSGFANVIYSNNDDMSVFLANAEADISKKLSDKVSVRVDTDLAIAGNGGVNAGLSGPKDSAVLEQVYFSLAAMEGVTVLGGVFNNPIGWETEDRTGMYKNTKGQIYGILDGQTALYGNNIAGVAVAGAVGPATITVAALNEIGHNDLEKNSFAAVVNATVVKDLDVELGYVTQEAGAKNVLDVNATYSIMGATIGVEYLMPEEVVDSAVGLMVNYKITEMFSATAMYDVVTPATGDDTTSYALAVTANLDKNLSVTAEYYNYNDGNDDDPAASLNFVATF